MALNFSDLEQQQEAANMHACQNAFEKAHPDMDIDLSGDCDDGEFLCGTCPWKIVKKGENRG